MHTQRVDNGDKKVTASTTPSPSPHTGLRIKKPQRSIECTANLTERQTDGQTDSPITQHTRTN